MYCLHPTPAFHALPLLAELLRGGAIEAHSCIVGLMTLFSSECCVYHHRPQLGSCYVVQCFDKISSSTVYAYSRHENIQYRVVASPCRHKAPVLLRTNRAAHRDGVGVVVGLSPLMNNLV